ncbi:hypothetical protein D3C75_1213440 [compost metagenome]
MLAVTLGVGQEKSNAFTAYGLGVLHRKPGQLVASKASPESNQDDRHRATVTHQRFVISPFNRSCSFPFKPGDRLLQVLQQ